MRWHWLIGLTALVWAHGVASAQQARMDIGLLTCGLVQGDRNPSPPTSHAGNATSTSLFATTATSTAILTTWQFLN